MKNENTLHSIYIHVIFFYFRLEVIQVVFVVIGVVMGLFAIILVVFGFLATGATRKNVYSGNKCIMGGRVSAAFVSNI